MDSQFSSKVQGLQSQVAELQERASGAELEEALDGLTISLQELLVAGEQLLRGAERERRQTRELAEDMDGGATLEALR